METSTRQIAALETRPSLLSRRAALGALACSCLALAGCWPETWQWNQKLVVEVQTPDGMRSGFAITNVRWQEANSAGNYPGGYTGEATVVDLGQGRYLFALIGEGTKYIALRTFADALGEFAGITESGFAAMSRIRGIREVPRDRYPLLVTFTDINDPRTVQRVDPDNLAATFGPGVSLKRIMLEITDENVMEGAISKVLPCLQSGEACVPLNKSLPYDDPMRNILNDDFWRK